MAKMCCSMKVKYNGTLFPPFTSFDVAEADIEGLLSKGAWIIEAPATSNQKSLMDEEMPKKPRRAKKVAK